MAETLAGRYSGHIRKKRLIGLLLLGVLAVSMILSLGTGSYPLTLGDMTAVLQGHGNEMTRHILLNIRLTRTCSGLAAGACLGMAGTIMQNVMKNPLASPFTLGVSQGAAFGAAFAIIILGAGSLHLSGSGPAVIASPWLMAAAAFTGSLVTVSLLVLLSSLRQMTLE
ncbi:MAG: iron chelate uptake ABC transporter family permease subunit, partial [Deltaproteobacteria bacterium]|nr:iron chelate uptake ABC transporter family permease subunit [Candidatus Tharpellaceae bacterium]